MRMRIMQTVTDCSAGQALREWRGDRTQAWLAKQLGVEQSTVSRLETGAMPATRAMALAIEHLSGGAVSASMWPTAADSQSVPAVHVDKTG